MQNLNRIFVFVRVIEKGSFTKAAHSLGVTISLVSQHISRLEEDLGVKLLHRTSRQLILTESGKLYYQQCSKVIEDLDAIHNQMQGLRVQPVGKLRINSPPLFGNSQVVPVVQKYRELHPQVEVDLILTDTLLDLLEHHIDVALHIGPKLKDSSMRILQIKRFRRVLCASPEYLKQNGIPKHPVDLNDHSWIIVNTLTYPQQWTFNEKNGQKRHTIHSKGTLYTNLPSTLLSFLQRGMGIGVIPEFFIEEELKKGSLVELLPEYQLKEGGVFVLHAFGNSLTLKARIFIDLMKEYL